MTPDPVISINAALNEFRVKSKLSQVDLAKRTGRTTTSVSRALTGKTKLGLDEWKLLADGLRMPQRDFFQAYYPSAFADEAADYQTTADHPGARALAERVAKVLIRIDEDPVEALFEAADMDTDWTIGAAAHLADRAFHRQSASLPVALYFYGRVLQDRNFPTRAHNALNAARLLAEGGGAEGRRLVPYILLSLANLAVEDNREPEGIGLFDDVWEMHRAGALPLDDPRQFVHLHGFGTEAKVLRRIQIRGEAARSLEDPALVAAEADLDKALASVEHIDRPHWQYRFRATLGLVRVLRGDKAGLEQIASGASWFRNHRSPSETDAGVYIHAVNVLAHSLLGALLSGTDKKRADEAEAIARRDGTVVALRVFALARRFAPVVMVLLMITLALTAPTIAEAGNGCLRLR